MQWRDCTTLPSRGLSLRPVGKSSECFRMTAGVKSSKAQNERMFFRFAPESGHRATRLACPLCANCEQSQQEVRLFDHLVGEREHRGRDREAERLGGLQIDRQRVLRWLL